MKLDATDRKILQILEHEGRIANERVRGLVDGGDS